MTFEAMTLRGVHVEIGFGPERSIDLATQRKLQQAVEERGVEISSVRRLVNSLELFWASPTTRERLTVAVGPQKLVVSEEFRGQTLGALTKEIDEIVKAVVETLKPLVLTEIAVCIRKVAPAPLDSKDSRVYLGDVVLRLGDSRKRAFGRPIQTVGVKFYLPPFQARDEAGQVHEERDAVEARIESLNEDPSSLYLECTRRFLVASPPGGLTSMNEYLTRTSDFLDNQVVDFLRASDGDQADG